MRGGRQPLIVALALAVLGAAPAALQVPHARPRAPTSGELATRRHTVAPRPVRLRRPLAGTPVAVTVPTTSRAPVVPRDFLGLSFEMRDLPRLARYARRGDLVRLLRALGPAVMRFGGVTADAGPGRAISARSLARLDRLARRTGWRVLLTLRLGHPDAHAAGRLAAAARAGLGDRLAGVAIGNEPDAYVAQRLRVAPWHFRDYRRQLASYRRALRRHARGVPLVGPEASSGEDPLKWVAAEARRVRPALLTDHYYPATRCGARPTLRELLSAATRRDEDAMLTRLASISRRARIPLRVDETNNISCRGQPGVSDAFGAALWAVDYLTRAMHAGLAGVNFHDLVGSPHSYAPLAADGRRDVARGRLHAKPEWYALLLARRLLGDRAVRAQIGSRHAGGLTAAALRAAGDRLHVVLTNLRGRGAKPLLVRLRVPRRYARGTVLRLSARSRSARRDVTLGGRAVGPDGRWAPRRPLPEVVGRPGRLALALPSSSAALVTLYPRR